MQELHNSPYQKVKEQGGRQKQDEPSVEAEQLYANAKPRRTAGLRLFDIALYPVLSNFAVFAISVVFTFLTARGGDKKADGSLVYGKVGHWFQKRGVWMEEKFQSTGMSPKNAEMSKVVAFSFIDGSIMAFPIKWFEDRREKIAYWIDQKLGTVPADMSPYQAEPKQSWLSVLGGRFITAGIVVPTAYILSKKVAYRPVRNELDPLRETNPYLTIRGSVSHENNTSLNDIAFNDLSEKHALKWPKFRNVIDRGIQKITGVEAKDIVTTSEIKGKDVIHHQAQQGDLAFKTMARMTYFEAFYTSVCTAGLYISSRIIATFLGDKQDKNAKKAAAQKQSQTPDANVAEGKPVITPTKIEIPREPEAPAKRVHTAALEAERVIAQEQGVGQPALQGI